MVARGSSFKLLGRIPFSGGAGTVPRAGRGVPCMSIRLAWRISPTYVMSGSSSERPESVVFSQCTSGKPLSFRPIRGFLPITFRLAHVEKVFLSLSLRMLHGMCGCILPVQASCMKVWAFRPVFLVRGPSVSTHGLSPQAKSPEVKASLCSGPMFVGHPKMYLWMVFCCCSHGGDCNIQGVREHCFPITGGPLAHAGTCQTSHTLTDWGGSHGYASFLRLGAFAAFPRLQLGFWRCLTWDLHP